MAVNIGSTVKEVLDAINNGTGGSGGGDIGNGTITIKQAGVTKGTFTTNQSGDTTIELANSAVNQIHTATDGEYPLLFKFASGNTSTAQTTNGTKFSNNIYANPSTGTIYANDFVVDGKSIVGGGGSNLTMPIIRMGAVSDVNGTMEISTDNPLTFAVEVIGGELQVGDVLQLCGMQLYTYRNAEVEDARIRKYKMRQFAQYEITAEDLEKRYISISVDNEFNIRNLLRGGGRSTSTVHNYYTKYLRIRRPHPDNPNNALFSNAVPFQVFGKYDKDNLCSLGVVSIR